MKNHLNQEPSEATQEHGAERVVRRVYQKPEVVLFGSVAEFTQGAGTSAFDAGNKSRKAG